MQFVEHFTSAHVPGTSLTGSAGASFENGQITWSADGISTSGGVTTRSFEGTIDGKFGTMYGVTITDPEVSYDAAGVGEITAVVSGFQGAPVPPATTSAARVTVAEISDAGFDNGVFTATPAWEGVLATGSQQALDLGMTATQPVDGKSFHPEFLGQITANVRGHFYDSGTGSTNPKKPVLAPVTAASSITAASAVISGGYIEVKASGTGFDTSWRPGATGIYVGLANEQDITKVSSTGQSSGMEKFIASTYIPNIALVDGNFTDVEFSGAKSKLVKGAKYRVYTWTAHGNPTAGDPLLKSFPVSIAGIAKNTSKTTVKVTTKPRTKKAGKATVTVTGSPLVKVSGKVTFKLKKGKATKKVKAAKLNKNGKVVVKLPKLKKGKWKLTVKYSGDSNYKGSSKTVTIKVKK
ncbi:Ig-like domain repeat protein [Nocardioides sp. Bht2]|uniref:Ig-like domain repeat protein n=1 Tax=Nocardioides sp. Bht2 TaxID=3392297 RepID=UPI0039B6CB37